MANKKGKRQKYSVLTDGRGEGTFNSEKKPIRQTSATKRLAAEFKVAVQLASSMYKLLRPFIKAYGKPQLRFSLQARIQRVLQSTRKGVNAEKFEHGNWKLLEGLRFNSKLTITSLLNKQPLVSLTPDKVIKVQLAATTTKHMFKEVQRAVKGAVKIYALVTSLDNNEHKVIAPKPLIVDLEQDNFAGAVLQFPIPFGGLQLLVLAVGVHYLNDNGIIDNMRYKAAEIVFVRLLRDGQLMEFEAEAEHDAENKAKVEAEDDGIDWEMGD